MNNNRIITFLIRDIKLVNIKKLLIFTLFLVVYYYVFNNLLLQHDGYGNTYLLVVGYKPEELVQISMISLISALLFLIGITTIDLENNASIGYSLVASNFKVINMIIARSIFCLICYIITLIIASLYFTYIGYDLILIITIISNAMLFTYTSYIALVYLFAQRKVEIILSILIALATLYAPIIFSNLTLIILNSLYFITVMILVLTFSEKIYRNKLKEESNVKQSNNYVLSYIEFTINSLIESISHKIYNLIAKVMPKHLTKYLSFMYLDIQRNLKHFKAFLIIIVMIIVFNDDFLFISLISFIFYGQLVKLQYQNYKDDYWVYKIGVIKFKNYLIYKLITATIFNFIFILIFNVIAIHNIYELLLISILSTLATSVVSVVVWLIGSKFKGGEI